MSYRAGENVIDYSYCEADLVRSAKANVRFFIEIIIGLAIGIGLLGMLGSTLIGTISCLGGCLGCEECLETAACADECMAEMGCEECAEECDDYDDYDDGYYGDGYYGRDMGCWEELTAENIEQANECATCEGIDCFGRQGCFASDGCGDCEHCAGTMYYSITVKAGNTEKKLEISEHKNTMGIYYPSNVSSSYYRFNGYYDKEEGGTQYVDASGTIVKKLKNKMTLYGHYEEYRVGEEFIFELRLAALGMPDETISLQVGGSMSLIPIAPEKEGYDFVGWYLDGELVYEGNIKEGESFHLYTFGFGPDVYNGGVYTLTPKYAPKKYVVTFNVYGSRYEVDAAYGDTFGDVYSRFYYNYYSNLQYEESFFGWGISETTEPENKVPDTTKVEVNTTLYAIFRDPVQFKFYYNRNGYDYDYINVKLYEGQRNIVLSELSELAYISTDDAYPGYRFTGWYTSSQGADDQQAVNNISVINDSTITTYYARWKTTDYKLEYYAENYDSGTEDLIDTKTYSLLNSSLALKPAEEATRNYGYDFVGWCLTPERTDTPIMSLGSGTYGDKKLYAKYQPKTFDYTWFANGGHVNGSSINMNSVVYGQENQLPIPFREGYNFLGWKLDGTDIMVGNKDGYVDKFTFKTLGMAVTAASENKLTTEGFTLIAEWEIQKFNVTFIVDGKTVSEQTIDWGKYVVEPEAPTKTGYEFMYWKDSNGNRFYVSTEITKDWTLTAHFEINKYTVIFYVDGYACVSYGIPHGSTLAEAESSATGWPSYVGTVPRKQIGWFTAEEGGTQVSADSLIETDEVKVYAQFEYAKTFTFNGATNETQYYFVGDKYVFPEAYSTGYNFLGWGESESSTTVTYTKGQEVRIKDSMKTVYYPKFETIKYTIKYYVGNAQYKTDTYTIEDKKSLIAVGSSSAPIKTGYTFKGWLIDTNDDYIGEGSLVTELVGAWGDKAFIAVFENNKYTVTLKNEGGNIPVDVTFDKAFDFDKPSGREGCHFVGWAWKDYDVDDANKQLITDDQGKSKGVYDYADNRNAYPIFERNQYTFRWYVGSAVKAETYQKHFDTKVTAPANPVKEGYTFVGWYANAALTEEYDFTHEVVGAENVYAKFTINQYTVKFMVGNEQKKSVTLDYQASLATAIEEAQTYVNVYANEQTAKFKYWKDANSGTVYTTSSVVPAYNMTLVAVYDMPIYVHFDNGMGGGDIVKGPYYASANVSVPSVSRQGYTFLGWYRNNVDKVNGSSVSVTGSETAQTDYYYVAKWQANTYNIYYYIHDGYSYVLQKTEQYAMNQTEETGGFKLWNGGEKTGYRLDGWYKDQAGSAMSAIDNSTAGEGGKLSGDVYLYGAWKLQKYTITFKNLDGSVFKTMEIEYGKALTYQSWVAAYSQDSKPTEKSTFGGFVLQGTNKSYLKPDGTWTIGTYTWTEDIVLVARWY